MKRSALIIILGILLLFGAAFWPGSWVSWVQLDVRPGTAATVVARKLVDQGLLWTVYPMIFWTKILGADRKIKVGRYRFPKGRSAFWVVCDLISGHTQKIHLVVPEGFTSMQIAERLQMRMVCPADKFEEIVAAEKLEGFLFPATYDLDVGMEPKELVELFTASFNRVWTPEMEARAKEWGWSKREAVIFASIIEREVRDRAELPMISAVYHNRLKKKMRLEADPTVQFALGNWKSRLLYADINKTRSPYNTYLHGGLPPGPICNPGEDALKAALWPAESEALYFVAKEDGRHDFSKTFKEHSEKIRARDKMKRKKKG